MGFQPASVNVKSVKMFFFQLRDLLMFVGRDIYEEFDT